MFSEKKNVICFISLYLLLILSLNRICPADARSYAEIVHLKVENDKIIVEHFHDWSESTYHKRREITITHQNPFTEENSYSYIQCLKKENGKLLFKSPTPALTRLHISNDSKYIIGLSNIKLHNPFQLVIFCRNGRLIKKRHISASESELTFSEYQEFKRKYPEQHKRLRRKGRIIVKSGKVYIDFLTVQMPIWLGDAWHYLYTKKSSSHFSKNFSESVTNWVFWYKEPDPEIQLKYKGEELFSVSLLDPKGKRFEIPIQEPTPEEVLTVGNFGLMLDR